MQLHRTGRPLRDAAATISFFFFCAALSLQHQATTAVDYGNGGEGYKQCAASDYKTGGGTGGLEDLDSKQIIKSSGIFFYRPLVGGVSDPFHDETLRSGEANCTSASSDGRSFPRCLTEYDVCVMFET